MAPESDSNEQKAEFDPSEYLKILGEAKSGPDEGNEREWITYIQLTMQLLSRQEGFISRLDSQVAAQVRGYAEYIEGTVPRPVKDNPNVPNEVIEYTKKLLNELTA